MHHQSYITADCYDENTKLNGQKGKSQIEALSNFAYVIL